MITKQDFILLDNEVSQSVEEVFKFIKDNCQDHNYILYLADGEFRPEIKAPSSRLNPYGIDNQVDKYKDMSRLNFFFNFMRLSYSFPSGQVETIDDEAKITLELMIYTHIWESKPFLKQLSRIASLANGNDYEWNVTAPDMSKHTYISKNIRDILESKNLRIATTISNGYHSSLRNAFAHSEYYIDDYYKQIHLDTYKGDSWDISHLSYNDWTKRFLYTALLSYHFLNIKYQKRKSICQDFGKEEFQIVHPSHLTKSSIRKIYYDQDRDIFSFYRK